MSMITFNPNAIYTWADTGLPWDGNKANLQAYISAGLVNVVIPSLAYNICASTMNHIDYTFITKGEILQAQREASKLFPADYMLAKVDKLVRKHSCFTSMKDMMNAKGGYRPTLYTSKGYKDCAELRLIADYYDACMAQIGDDRRAYRV